MEVYEELVKNLRGCANASWCFSGCPEDVNGPCQEHLMSQAADAIEELSRAVRKRFLMQTPPENEKKANQGLHGKWEPLGHRPGILSHPDSEDYRCSLCGFEAYTLYFEPPSECPRCGADMKETTHGA